MTSRKRSRVPELQRTLSSLSSDISKWSTSTPSSPSHKCSPRSQAPVRRSGSSLKSLSQNSVPWYQAHSPRNVADVAIHKRKLQDVNEALVSILMGQDDTRILLLTGPSGASKSTVVTQLAKVLIPKYKQMHSGGFFCTQSDVNQDSTDESVIEYGNDGKFQSESFQEFLSHAKYKVGPNLALILIEDIPNVFQVGTRQMFQRNLLEWLYNSETTLPPLVICLTECELESDTGSFQNFGIDNTFTAESVLGNELLSHPKLKRIKFNPINTSLMKKHLVDICNCHKEFLVANKKWCEKDEFVNRLANSTGDIRSGIATLEFWVTSSGSIPMSTRQNSVSFFHAVGRVLYGSNDFKDDHEMINSMMESFQHHFSSRNSRLGLLENYGSFNKGQFDIEIASQITESLSISDTLNRVPESLEYSLRSVRNNLSTIGTSKITNGKSFFPREWKIQKLMDELKVKSSDYVNVSLYKYNQARSSEDVALYFGFYEPFIRSCQSYKKRAMDHYLMNIKNATLDKQSMTRYNEFSQIDPSFDLIDRLGGVIRLIGGQEVVVSEEDGLSLARKSVLQLRMEKENKLAALIRLQESRMILIDNPVKNEEQDFVDDPIIDSDHETPDSNSSLLEENDSFYDQLLKKSQTVNKKLTIDESLSDSDLEIL